MHTTFWTVAFLATCNQALFSKVGNICGKDGEHAADPTIAAGSVHSLFPCFDDGLKKFSHAVVEKAIAFI